MKHKSILFFVVLIISLNLSYSQVTKINLELIELELQYKECSNLAGTIHVDENDCITLACGIDKMTVFSFSKDGKLKEKIRFKEKDHVSKNFSAIGVLRNSNYYYYTKNKKLYLINKNSKSSKPLFNFGWVIREDQGSYYSIENSYDSLSTYFLNKATLVNDDGNIPSFKLNRIKIESESDFEIVHDTLYQVEDGNLLNIRDIRSSSEILKIPLESSFDSIYYFDLSILGVKDNKCYFFGFKEYKNQTYKQVRDLSIYILEYGRDFALENIYNFPLERKCGFESEHLGFRPTDAIVYFNKLNGVIYFLFECDGKLYYSKFKPK